MGTTLQWFGHASFKITHADKVIYIDPWKIKDATHDATIVLVSHSHYDHYSAEDISQVSGKDTKLIASSDVVAQHQAGEPILPGQTIKLDGISVQGVAAYNHRKPFHQKANNWVGFIIQLDSKRIYYAGDSDVIDEMKDVSQIDVALLPVGGTYTMNAKEAAEAVGHINPKMVIPYHWGDIVGGKGDAEKFSKMARCDTRILTPGQSIDLE